MKRTLSISILIGLALIALAAPAQAPAAKDLAGEWKGTLMGQLPLVLHLTADASGALGATMDSPAQGANNLAGANVKLTGPSLTFDIPVIGGSYSGKVGADGKTINGTLEPGNAARAGFDQAVVQPRGSASELGQTRADELPPFFG